VSSILTQCI